MPPGKKPVPVTPQPFDDQELDTLIQNRYGNAAPQGDAELDTAITRRYGAPAPAAPKPLNLPGAPGGPFEGQPLPVWYGNNADDFLVHQLGPLGPVGFKDIGTRALLGLTDDLEEQKREFALHYPQGELREVEIPEDMPNYERGTKILMFRPDPNTPWARFDEPSLTIGDAADISKQGPTIAAEAGVAALSSGMSLPAQVALQAGTGALTTAGTEAVQVARGIKQDFSGTLKRSLLEGGAAGAGYLVGGAGSYLVRGGLGLGASNVSKPAAEAIAGAKSVGLPRLFAGQVVENPLLSRIFQQAQAKTTAVGERVAAQQQKIIQAVQNRASSEDLRLLGDGMEKLEQQTRKQLNEALGRWNPTIMADESAGAFTAQALNDWEHAAKGQLQALYGQARQQSGNGIVFDLTAAKKLVEEYRFLQQTGAVGRIAEKDPELKDLMRRIEEAPAYLTDQHKGTAFVSGAPETLDTWRGDAFRAKTPDALGGRTDEGNQWGGKLFKVLSNTFDTPLGHTEDILGLSPRAREFVNTWNRARTAAREYFGNRDMMEKIASATDRVFNPEAFAKTLTSSTRPDAIRNLNKVLASQGMENRMWYIQQAFKRQLAERLDKEGPDATEQYLKAWSPTALRELLGEGELNGFRDIMGARRKMDALGIGEIKARQDSATEKVISWVAQGNKSRLDQLLALPEDSEVRRAISAGLWDHLVAQRRVVTTATAMKGMEVLDHRRIRAFMEMLDKSGAGALFSKDDREFLALLEKHARFSNGSIDMGSVLAGAELAGKAEKSIFSPAALTGVIGEIFRIAGAGRLLSNRAGRALFVGAFPGQNAKLGQTIFGTAGAASASILYSLAQERAGGKQGMWDIFGAPLQQYLPVPQIRAILNELERRQ